MHTMSNILTDKRQMPVIKASLIAVFTITAAAFYDALDTMNASFLHIENIGEASAQSDRHLSNEYYCLDLTA